MKEIGKTVTNNGKIVPVYMCPNCCWRSLSNKRCGNCMAKIKSHKDSRKSEIHDSGGNTKRTQKTVGLERKRGLGAYKRKILV